MLKNPKTCYLETEFPSKNQKFNQIVRDAERM